MRLNDRVAILLQPQESIAPIRSEVVVVASVLGSDGYLRTNEPVHWHLDPNGVGQIVDVCPGSFVDWLVGDFTRPRKLSNHYAVSSTSRRYLLLTRGTVNPEDDISILAGQTWVSVTSAVEGTSLLTAFAPGVRDWSRRTQTAKIYWVDAQWSLPSPAIVPAGSRHQLVTTITRQSDQAPCRGWLVRYHILSGPPTAFLPGGETLVEIPTNDAGQAVVEIAESQPVPGTTAISIEIVKAATLDSSGRPLVIGRGTTHVTWSSPGLTVRKSAPSTVPVGANFTYRIEVVNPGDLPAADVVVRDQLPSGITYLKSNPEPTQPPGATRELRWQLGTLASGESRVITVEVTAERPGRIENTATASAHGGLESRSTASTEVGAPNLQVRLRGPKSAKVGESVSFMIELTNGGNQPLPGLVLKARFDPGLRHAVAPSPIERDLGQTLQPGQTQQVGVEFQAVATGQHCLSIDVLSAGTVLASTKECLEISEGVSPGTLPPSPRGEAGPGPASGIGAGPRATTALRLRILGPEKARVGEMVEFVIDLTNPGTKPAENLQIRCQVDPPLQPRFASGGFEPRRPGEVSAPFIWRRDSILPNQTVQYRLQCTAQQESPQACLQVEVTTGEGATLADKRCVAIGASEATPSGLPPSPAAKPASPPPPALPESAATSQQPSITAEQPAGPLIVNISTLRPEVKVGQPTTLVVKVSNIGSAPQRDVRLRVRLPPELQRVKFGTLGPPGAEDPTFDDSTIRFPPLSQLAPAATAEYRVVVAGAKPGEAQLSIEVTSREAPLPTARSISLRVLQP
jgi:uncharacterized repeat protein (TIGR01451 family)